MRENLVVLSVRMAISIALAGLCLALAASACPAADLSEISFSCFDGGLYPLSAALSWEWRELDLKLGWVPLDWGPSPGYDLAFSPTRGHFMLYMDGDFTGMELIPPFRWEQAYIILEHRNGKDRYMLARRYEVEAGRWNLGYVEMAVLSGDFSPLYLNPYPLIPLEVTQLCLEYFKAEGAGPVNAVMAVDARWQGERASAYCSFYVDDIPPTEAWNIPYRVAAQAGLEIEDPFGWTGTKLWTEYTAISRYNYSYRPGLSQGDYVDGDLLLGHPLGPDADLVLLRLALADGLTWLGLERERHGEARFPDPVDETAGRVLDLLTGVVETSYWLKYGRAFELGKHLELQLELGAAYVRNLDNVEGETGSKYCLNLQVGCWF